METSLQLRLQHQPAALHQLLSGLSEEQIRLKPLPDKWSIFENIAHLGRIQEIYLERMHLIQLENNPTLKRYVAEEDAGFPGWCKKNYKQLLNDFETTRQQLIDYLFSLNEEQFQRTAKHSSYGTMNVSGWMEFFLLHETHHFFTIFKLAALLKNN